MAYDCWYQMKIEELLDNMEIWTTNEETKLLKKLKSPVAFNTLSSHDKVKIEYMIKKGLVEKTGFKNPTVVANEKSKKDN